MADNRKAVVVWNDGASQNISLNLADSVGKNIVVYDMYGNEIENYTNNSSTVSITIDDEPRYIVYAS